MAKILVFVASCNVGGNTESLADAFIQGAKDNGHEVKNCFSGTTL